MIPQTTNASDQKTVAAIAKLDDPLDDLDIVGHCFLLIALYQGSVALDIGGKTVTAQSPVFICLDERISPSVLSKQDLVCDSVYFDPTFINIHMTFERMRSEDYKDVAEEHELFLLRPFTDTRSYAYPIYQENIATIRQIFAAMAHEWATLPDRNWSCRSRSYLMELILLAEHAYDSFHVHMAATDLQHPALQKALHHIDAHYPLPLTLSRLASVSGVSTTYLTQLFRHSLGVTPMHYVWETRCRIAKKQLVHTKLSPIELAQRCGFLSLSQFRRKFQAIIGRSPDDYRSQMVEKRYRVLG